METGDHFRAVSQKVSPSKKSTKTSAPVFGSSSQFAGVGRGVPGDPRK